MSCDAPLQSYRSASVNPATGKHGIQFTLAGSLSGSRMMLPCGKCLGCRLEWSRRWAVRCMHERRMSSESCFLTLTYDNAHLPAYGDLQPRHLQLFHKRLHNKLLRSRGKGIRYYSCGEYGSINERPHYHSLIFGYDFPDKKVYSRSQYGNLYTSKSLQELWIDELGDCYGECKIGEVTFESAAYVARYCVKKVNGPKKDDGHYIVYDADGLVFERRSEFAHMSRNPGIGATYFEKYGHEIAQHDTIIINGREVPSIRYYDLRIPEARLKYLKALRMRKAVWAERQVDRRRVKADLRVAVNKSKRRSL